MGKKGTYLTDAAPTQSQPLRKTHPSEVHQLTHPSETHPARNTPDKPPAPQSIELSETERITRGVAGGVEAIGGVASLFFGGTGQSIEPGVEHITEAATGKR
jgi:hypothetical protein